MTRIFLLMILCHIIDDFVFQPICLSNLKQKEYWDKTFKDDKHALFLYEKDYIAALIIHGVSWAIMIHLPLIFMTEVSGTAIGFSVLINATIHALIDNIKANKKSINLIMDQFAHFVQICIIFTYLVAL